MDFNPIILSRYFLCREIFILNNIKNFENTFIVIDHHDKINAKEIESNVKYMFIIREIKSIPIVEVIFCE